MVTISFLIAMGVDGRDNSPLLESLKQCQDSCPSELSFETIFFFDGIHPQIDPTFEFTAISSDQKRGQIEARNTLAAVARGEIIVFLDDDLRDIQFPWTQVCDLLRGEAVAIRGRLTPDFESGALPRPSSWDLGDELRPSPINLEGLSAFRRREFLEAGGFPIVPYSPLAHEGLNLSLRLAQRYGVASCVYMPWFRGEHPVRPEVMAKRSAVVNYVLDKPKVKLTDLETLFYDSKIPEVSSSTFLVSLDVILTVRDWKRSRSIVLESISRQLSKPDCFIVVIDDFQSAELVKNDLEQVAQTDVIVVRNNSSGRASALNLALTYSKGHYFAIWDIDDWYFPHHISSLRLLLANASEAPDLILGNMLLMDPHSNLLSVPERGIHNRIEFLTELLKGKNPVVFPASCFKRQPFSPFREELNAGIDINFIFDNASILKEIRSTGEIHGTHAWSEESISYRFHEEQKSGHVNLQRQSLQAITDFGVSRLWSLPIDEARRIGRTLRTVTAAEISELQAELRAVEANLAASRNSNRELEELLLSTEERRHHADSDLAEIRNSITWRISFIPRIMISLVRRGLIAFKLGRKRQA